MWEEFIGVMSKLLDLYKRLLQLTKEKRLVIVAVKLKELEALVNKERLLVDAVGKCEQERMVLLTKLTEINQMKKADKMLDLLKYCDKKTGQRIVEIHTELTETLRVLTKEGKLNNDLVRQALGVVNYKLNIVSGAAVDTTYGASGSERVNTRSNLNFNA